MIPPYARAIANARFEGRHPAMILIAIAPRAQWFKINDHRYPFVFVPEEAYLQGRFEWWFCAGVPVTLYPEATEAATWLALAGELADLAAPVYVQSATHDGDEIDQVMRSIRYRTWLGDAWWVERDPVTGWPPWWSDERDARYSARRDRWIAEQRAEGAA